MPRFPTRASGEKPFSTRPSFNGSHHTAQEDGQELEIQRRIRERIPNLIPFPAIFPRGIRTGMIAHDTCGCHDLLAMGEPRDFFGCPKEKPSEYRGQHGLCTEERLEPSPG